MFKENYTVWVVTPGGVEHSRCFDEVALALRDGVVELGHECRIVRDMLSCRGRTIVLGGHLLGKRPEGGWNFPKDMVIYNLEQVGGTGGVGVEWLRDFQEEMVRWGHRVEVWDYSLENIRVWREAGVGVKHCPVGYVPGLTRIEASAGSSDEIEVLFVGSMNPRREVVLRELEELGVKVRWLFGVYGKERDAFIARSKLILNIHFYDSKVFEIVRCSYLFANKKFIISEAGNDRTLEDLYVRGAVFGRHGDLARLCVEYLGKDRERAEIAQRGFDIFSRQSQVEFLRGVL